MKQSDLWNDQHLVAHQINENLFEAVSDLVDLEQEHFEVETFPSNDEGFIDALLSIAGTSTGLLIE